MLTELCTNEYVIYDVKIRVAKDAYSERKIQKDIRKLEKWLHALLDHHEVIIFYRDDDKETVVVGSRIPPHNGLELLISPLEDEIVNGKTNKVANHCCFFTVPGRVPMMIHFNNITKFIVKIDNVAEISKSIQWH
jgi:hypothetical protein